MFYMMELVSACVGAILPFIAMGYIAEYLELKQAKKYSSVRKLELKAIMLSRIDHGL